MRKLAVPALLLALCACASHRPITNASEARAAGHGAIAVHVAPDQVRAKLGYENSYRFPVEMVIRETNGHPVQIARVSVRVMNASMRTNGGTARWTAKQLRELGVPTTIPANGEVTLKLGPIRASNSNKQLEPSGVTAEIVVQALDETNTESQAWAAMTVVTR